jgi:hypothetical protein
MPVDRAWLKAHVDVEIYKESEEAPCDFEDEEDVKWVQHELDMGNTWAWCTVRVRVGWNDHETETWLGACSYQDEAAFKAGGYYDDMVDECVGDLAKRFETLMHTHGLWEHDKTLCFLCLTGCV